MKRCGGLAQHDDAGDDQTFIFLLQLLEWNLKHNLTQSSFTELLQICRERLPTMFPEETLPGSFSKAVQHVAAFGLPSKCVDMCPNGCCRFDGVNAACAICPTCKEDRWLPEMMTKPVNKRRGRTSFYYWDLASLLKRMYAHPQLSVDMQAHARHVPCDLDTEEMETMWGASCSANDSER